MYFNEDDIEQNKVLAILAYIIFLVPLLVAKDSQFAKYHTNQGLVLFLFALASGIGMSILNFILDFVPVIGWIMQVTLNFILPFLIIILAIIGIINAANGKAKPLPIIGNINILK